MAEEMKFGKLPPHSIDAEQSVLGSMLLDKEATIVALETVRADDFYKAAHEEIFDCIVTLFNRNEPVDLVTLTEELRKRDKLSNVGGIPYLTGLSSSVPVASNVKHYAEIVSEKSTLRRLIRASEEVVSLGYDKDIQVPVLLERAQKNIYDISQYHGREGLIPIRDVLRETFNKVEELYQSDKKLTGMSSGFLDIDKKLNGFHPSDLILVAARPAMGKSAFALNLAQNAAIKEGSSVAIFSLEMSKEQLMQRMLSSESMVEINKIQTGSLNEKEWAKISRAMAPLSQAQIYFDDSPGITVTEMRSKCRRLNMESTLDLVLVDYLQLMQGGGRTENRQQEISAISRNLKIMAKELNCPVIALSQLSRAPELRSDHRPILSDLRESGAIEQDADLVMFLYRDEYYHEESDKKGIAEIIIAKHRHGETGTVELRWEGSKQKFLDLNSVHKEP